MPTLTFSVLRLGRRFHNGGRFVERDEKRQVVLSDNTEGGDYDRLSDAMKWQI